MESVRIPLSVLLAMADDAQVRARVAKSIISEMESIGSENIGYDETGQYHSPRGLHLAAIKAEKLPVWTRIKSTSLAVAAVAFTVTVYILAAIGVVAIWRHL